MLAVQQTRVAVGRSLESHGGSGQGSGRGGSCREPQGKDKGTGTDVTVDNSSAGGAPATPMANEAVHAAQGPWALQGPCLDQAQRHLPDQKSEPKPQAQPCPPNSLQMWGWVSVGPGHL